eukprot:NODE_1517_length_1701_cov_92.633714_g1439_i0.p1 GENE.NODE_1517_length_1701_cov_92.633714_g1439_i0~~NODE_1517_length_1701_cov_92.633714_g1439_i0.p1  ORF type:complete len:476 (-),score=48.32 NODE_1517_length_1701_cov_92.633714_g1439_i0:214-1641(-)
MHFLSALRSPKTAFALFCAASLVVTFAWLLTSARLGHEVVTEDKLQRPGLAAAPSSLNLHGDEADVPGVTDQTALSEAEGEPTLNASDSSLEHSINRYSGTSTCSFCRGATASCDVLATQLALARPNATLLALPYCQRPIPANTSVWPQPGPRWGTSGLRDWEGTYQAQDWLYRWQHPPDCGGRRFLLFKMRNSGVGGSIHGFSWALAGDRVESRTHHQRALVLVATAVRSGVLLRADLELHPATRQAVLCRSVHRSALSLGLIQADWLHTSAVLVPSVFSKQHGKAWWRAQSFRYFIRELQPHVANYIYWQRQEAGITVPTGAICMHVRRSDKSIEMGLVPFSKFIRAAETVKRWERKMREVVTVFVTTESDAVVEEASFYRKDYRFLFFPELRMNENHHQTAERTSPEYLMLISLINLSYQMECQFFVGTRQSSWSRFIDRLKKTANISRHVFMDLCEGSYTKQLNRKQQLWY